ncbi:MAG: hypothetical protein D6677_05790 [Calditrichaeota bacterium]|nr:MAG: hypothetical protein D6677_05790 [Calditrichota bacterium]
MPAQALLKAGLCTVFLFYLSASLFPLKLLTAPIEIKCYDINQDYFNINIINVTNRYRVHFIL